MLTIETLEQGVKYFQNQQQRNQSEANGVVLMSFTPCSSASIVNFE